MNKDFDQPNATICEHQNIKNHKSEDPEILKGETSLSCSSHYIESNIRLNQNDIDEIIANIHPKIPDDNCKVEIEDYVAYQHFTPEHYEEKNHEIDQKVLEETIIPVRIADFSREPTFDYATDKTPKQKTVPLHSYKIRRLQNS